MSLLDYSKLLTATFAGSMKLLSTVSVYCNLQQQFITVTMQNDLWTPLEIILFESMQVMQSLS